MPVSVSNRSGAQTASFEVLGLGDSKLKSDWELLATTDLGNILWNRFWSQLASGESTLDRSMFDHPGRSGKSEKSINPTNEVIGKAWQAQNDEALSVQFAWMSALQEARAEYEKRLGQSSQYSQVDSIDRQQRWLDWPPPRLALIPKDATSAKVYLQNGIWSIQQAVSDRAKDVSDAANAAGRAVGDAAANAASGAANALTKSPAGIAAGLGGLALAALVIAILAS